MSRRDGQISRLWVEWRLDFGTKGTSGLPADVFRRDAEGVNVRQFVHNPKPAHRQCARAAIRLLFQCALAPVHRGMAATVALRKMTCDRFTSCFCCQGFSFENQSSGSFLPAVYSRPQDCHTKTEQSAEGAPSYPESTIRRKADTTRVQAVQVSKHDRTLILARVVRCSRFTQFNPSPVPRFALNLFNSLSASLRHPPKSRSATTCQRHSGPSPKTPRQSPRQPPRVHWWTPKTVYGALDTQNSLRGIGHTKQ